jgi:hypothetical protein
MANDMIVGEPHPYAVASTIPCEPISSPSAPTTTMMMMGIDDEDGQDHHPLGPHNMAPSAMTERGTSPIELLQSSPRASPPPPPALGNVDHDDFDQVDRDGEIHNEGFLHTI